MQARKPLHGRVGVHSLGAHSPFSVRQIEPVGQSVSSVQRVSGEISGLGSVVASSGLGSIRVDSSGVVASSERVISSGVAASSEGVISSGVAASLGVVS